MPALAQCDENSATPSETTLENSPSPTPTAEVTPEVTAEVSPNPDSSLFTVVPENTPQETAASLEVMTTYTPEPSIKPTDEYLDPDVPQLDMGDETENLTITGFVVEDNALFITLTQKGTVDTVLGLLPNTLAALFSDGQQLNISVLWMCTDNYDQTEFDTYTFVPVWDEYDLADGVISPKATVNIDNTIDILSDPPLDNPERYTITIPSQISLNSELYTGQIEIIANGINLSEGKSIQITVVSKNDFVLHSNEGSIPYEVHASDTNQLIQNGDIAAVFHADGKCRVNVSVPYIPEVSGVYVDTLTFAISIEGKVEENES